MTNPELLEKGEAHRLKKEYDQAMAFFEKAIEQDEQDAKAWYGKGIVD